MANRKHPDSVGTIGKYLRNWRATLLLVLYQIVPVTAQEDNGGRITLGIGFGAAGYEQASFDCSGAKTFSRGITLSNVNALVEYAIPGSQFSVSAFGGNVNSSIGALVDHQANGQIPPPDFPLPIDGSIAGATLGWDSEKYGAKAGFVVSRDTGETEIQPSFSARLGTRSKPHFLLNHNIVRSAGQLPTTAIGVGIGNSERTRSVSGFAGLGRPMLQNTIEYSVSFGLMGDVTVPIGSRVDLTFAGMAGGSSLRSFSAGLRVHTQARKKLKTDY